MDYCKYHPLSGATYICHQCAIHQCDKCVDDDDEYRSAVRCFICGSVLESLGSANTVEPFWRRLKEAFKYPVNASSLGLIIGTSLISVLANLIPFVSLLIYLFAAGAMLKYSFTCLERTALGEMTAPDVTDAYEGGIKLLVQLLLITIVLMLAVGLVGYYVSTALGGFLAVAAVFSYPAILIRFAQSENMFEAMNPFGAMVLITAIGLPYGLLMVFILIMISSVGVLHELIGNVFPVMSYLLQSIISNYYMIVIFHIMGYMLFQYQEQLGYAVRAEYDDDEPKRTEAERLVAKIEVLLKEGDYELVVKLYHQAFKQFPNEKLFCDKYFELLYACKKSALMEDYALDYLEFILKKKRFDKLTLTFKRILLIAPDYLPDSPAIRLQLAKLFKQQGELKFTLKLLNGMYKLYPDFAELVDAYGLLADTLAELPEMQVQAEKCRQLVVRLQRKAAEKLTAQTREPLQVEIKNKPQSMRKGESAQTKPMTLELVPLEPETIDYSGPRK